MLSVLHSASVMYYAVAVLADQLFSLTSTMDPTGIKSEELSYAIWQIFDPIAYMGYPGNTASELEQTTRDDVSKLMTSALAAAADKR